ncbi:hypothetical protein GLOIN_2v1594040 [Rhizophagus irregularis DAOM 181602=DAOM 197198]|uniref:Uncharacterized protein n=1 Tax=Rhizophagus irregularis (strain DAOM 181602 / DAOM 197198 / MUCL 43194) TaxID=747089 RepID=A0A2P4Q4R3_RHIID|nr:hypothetical protein GLOIN_2v1594040 [Rhizophagus irregularis DAOM 181602=DAOM 197198]POG72643.1 hypothetical protein GLOIN_2v1594040 [Rhizophagus irregularis DAOM 181602=DAOM 197198]|eukprot:XP_025179509.1 hypothetical protein GLOIN_2v1594040 [Rhizophagus irregularis DAOM 181602=DAOM 197198]
MLFAFCDLNCVLYRSGFNVINNFLANIYFNEFRLGENNITVLSELLRFIFFSPKNENFFLYLSPV